MAHIHVSVVLSLFQIDISCHLFLPFDKEDICALYICLCSFVRFSLFYEIPLDSTEISDLWTIFSFLTLVWWLIWTSLWQVIATWICSFGYSTLLKKPTETELWDVYIITTNHTKPTGIVEHPTSSLLSYLIE